MAERTICRRYSTAFKRQLVADITSGKYTVFSASRVFGVGYGTVQRWWKQKTTPQQWPQMLRIQMPDEASKVKQLEKEKQALESALAQAQLKIITLEATLEVIEENAKATAKKKIGTGSLPKSSTTKPTGKGTSR
jgi:transposase-like protein